MSGAAALEAHLKGGLTTVCQAWAVTRRDGVVLGFTDHDRDLSFDGLTFRADTGLTAFALEQSMGLSVNNTEALGALSDVGLTEADLRAGRYDGAEVRAWQVNWQDVAARRLVFRGTLGEITQTDGAFRAELRGLSAALNQPQGRVYQKPCPAVLGNARCGFDLAKPGYAAEMSVAEVTDRGAYALAVWDLFEDGWFARGELIVLDGDAVGLRGHIKRDVASDGLREVVLWEPLRAVLAVGDRVRLSAGCDKRAETCRLKFNNFTNFQGFPHLPPEDWIMVHPAKAMPRGGADG